MDAVQKAIADLAAQVTEKFDSITTDVKQLASHVADVQDGIDSVKRAQVELTSGTVPLRNITNTVGGISTVGGRGAAADRGAGARPGGGPGSIVGGQRPALANNGPPLLHRPGDADEVLDEMGERAPPIAAWRRAVAATPSLTGGSHHQQQHNLRYLPLPLRPPAPPNALGLAERLFSSSSTKRSTKKSAAKKDIPVDSTSGGDPFYVVRKGDVISIYKNLSDCQAQVSNSVCDPSVSVFKGYSLRKETEEYLAARGLKNALYSINAADARDELFDDLALCPFQHPDGNATSTLERPQEMLSCILEFDGACKGNPGKAGAGVIVRQPDGSVIAQLREGLGIATCNTAEYHALLLGLRYADKEGFKYIRAQGDSRLVCNQEFNADADAQANLAIELPVGGIQEQSNMAC
ncbi:hypothetical protein ACQ4PT_052170 [Festuca glaucescens]